MSQPSRQKWLNTRLKEAMARHRRTREETAQHHGAPPRLGDVFAFAASAEYPVQWAVLEQDPHNPSRLLVVALDANPLVGSSDIALPTESSTGASTLRCAFTVWLDAGEFDPDLRSGSLAPEVLAHGQRAEIERGDATGSVRQHDTEEEPEYLDWIEEVVAPAQAALSHLSPRTALELTIQVDTGDDAHPEDLDQLTRLLLAELRSFDVERAELLRGGSLPAGAGPGKPWCWAPSPWR